MKRTAIYARISEKGRNEDKVAGQIADCRSYFEPLGYDMENAVVFSEEISATKDVVKRPQWLALLDAIERGEFEVVVATEEERLARGSRTDKADLVAACQSTGTVWHTIRDGFVDPNNEGGEFMSDIRDAVARQEVRRKTSRQLARYTKEIAKGNPLWGPRMFGYKADRLNLDQDEAQLLKGAYSHIINGGKIYGLIKDWNEKGVLTSTGRRWSYSTMQQMLRRPRNAGIVMHRDVEQVGVKPSWEPVIPRNVWDTVQAVLNDPTRRTAPGRKPVHLAAGLLFCEVCGAVMRSGIVKLKGIKTPIYRCSTKANVGGIGERHPTIQTDILDPLIRPAIVSAFLFAPLNTLLSTEVRSTAHIEAELSKVRAARARILKLVAEGLIDDGDDAVQLRDLKKREAPLVEKLKAERQAVARETIGVDLRLDLYTGRWVSLDDAAAARVELYKRWDALSLDKKRDLIRTHLEIKVDLGRSTKRVTIIQKVAVSLNAEVDAAREHVST